MSLIELANTPGLLILFGSGETLASSKKTHEYVARYLSGRPVVSVLETPAGFEPNSAKVAGAVADFIQHHLQNYKPQTCIVPARKLNTPFSPDDPEILAPLLDANWIFLGPGSPTYAKRQLAGSLAYNYLAAKHRLGAVLMLASAATLAFSAHTMPVYEIYKVGMDLHWQTGLNFLRPFGLELVFIPHWNNNDGGSDLDTSRCYMGQARFDQLVALLPTGTIIVGLDEHTAAVLDFKREMCTVMGKGAVTLVKSEKAVRYHSGEEFSLDEFGDYRPPNGGEGIPEETWFTVQRHTENQLQKDVKTVPEDVLQLVNLREEARRNKDWEKSDYFRNRIADQGWEIRDTPNGPEAIWKEPV